MDEITGMWPNKNKQEIMGNLKHCNDREIEGEKAAKFSQLMKVPLKCIHC